MTVNVKFTQNFILILDIKEESSQQALSIFSQDNDHPKDRDGSPKNIENETDK